MKQLQNNFTDEKQSRRLLKLRLPADSADIGGFEDIMHSGMEILSIPYSQWCKGYENISHPIWSVGRLMDIWEICGNRGRCVTVKKGQSRIESLVKLYEENALYADFSKLDE